MEIVKTPNLKTLNQNTFYDEYLYSGYNLNEKFIKQMKNDSHIKILKGNIAQNGCVTKIYSNISSLKKKRVKVFDSENEFLNCLVEYYILAHSDKIYHINNSTFAKAASVSAT